MTTNADDGVIDALEKVERVSRTLLWLALASACIVVPAVHRQAQADAKQAVHQAAERGAEQARRIGFKQIGPYLYVLDARDCKLTLKEKPDSQ